LSGLAELLHSTDERVLVIGPTAERAAL